MTSQLSARTERETGRDQTERQQPRSSMPSRSERGIRRSLRGKILVRALGIALVPLLVIGSITLGSLVGLSRRADQTLESERQQLGNEVAGQRLRTEASAIALELDGFLHERISDVTGWASDPTVTEAAIAAAEESQRYAAEPDDQLNAQFADVGQIGATPLVRQFLRHQLEREPAFSSIFFTERNGFNVTGTSRPADFAQRGNEWWVSAQIRGLHFGAIEYDAEADQYSLPLSARVKNPMTGEGFGGVLQARMGVDLLHQVARRHAGPEGRQVTILTGDGRLLVETGSKQGDRRIMRQGVTFEGDRQHAVDTALAASETGFAVRDDIIVGYAPLMSVRDRPDGTAADINAFLGIDANPINWVVLVEQPTEAAFAELNGLTIVREGLNTTAMQLGALGLVALILAVVAATMVSTRLSSRIVQPLLSLRGAAYDISERQLPELIDHVQRGDGDEDLPAVPAVKVETDDEVEDVADAFNVVRDTAVGLAVEQARSRRNFSTMFVNLGRRNQNLLSKQLEFIDELERDEADTRLREILFRLDHLATRMRRNAESLLVLAGEESPRRWAGPIPLFDVLQDAISEVEEYQRVDIRSVDEVRIVGQAASDIAHLLAELIENATNFSPPDSPVAVIGWWVSEGYALSIIDDGIGMTEEELRQANQRLLTASSLHRVPSSYLGLFVIGHLAARHGITVRLVEAASDGVAAKVLLPHALLADQSSSTEPPPAAGVGGTHDRRGPDDGAPLPGLVGASRAGADGARRRGRRDGHDDDVAGGVPEPARLASPGVTVPIGGAGSVEPVWPSAQGRTSADADAAELEARKARERLGRYQRAVRDGQAAVSAGQHHDPETRERS